MATHQLAQGLASLGRNNDSMLMHVTPNEVAGLKTLARSMGGEVTTNPHTGLPEAGFFDFLGNMLPTAVALMLAAPTGGGSLAALPAAGAATAAAPGLLASMQMAPILGGMATGAAVAGARGDDVLSGALMGGLSGVGAPGMADAFSKMAAPAVGNVGSTIGNATTTLGNVGGTGEIGSSLLKSGITPAAETALSTQISPFTNNALGSSLGVAPGANTAAPNFIPGGYDAAANSMGGLGNLSNAGSAIGDFMKNPIDAYNKFTSPAVGGSGMQLATTVGLPALSAMQPEPYDFAADEAKRKAEENKYRDPITGKLNLSASSGLNLTGFAMGGQVDSNPSVGGGISDLYNRPEGATTQSISSDGYGMGRLDRLSQQGSLAKAGDTFYAQGGPVSFADGGDTGMNIEGLGSLNVNTGMQSGAGMGAGMGDGLNKNFSELMFESMYRGIGPETARKLLGMSKSVTQNVPKSYALNVNSGQQEAQYARGGYLNGQGDGMSDSIPATIEGKQPARLADGEFVVPADVVSHLGNGSSKAGSKRLYAMLDKIRHARTGNKKQGKQINPNKYMPA